MAFTDEEKEKIVARYQNGELGKVLCAELAMLYRWAKVYCPANPGQERTFTIREYDALRRKVEKQASIIAILKAVDCTVSAPLKERLLALESLYNQYDVHTLCAALDVSRGTGCIARHIL